MSETKEAVERLELITAKAAHLIRWTESDAHDLSVVLSTLQEAREALGPFAKAWGRSDRNAPYSTSPRIFPALDDFRRAAEVYRALSPGGAEQ